MRSFAQMNVVLLNTYAHGGAGVACRRLHRALQQAGGVQTATLVTAGHGPRWPFYAERLSFLPYERDRSVRFSFSLANFGQRLANHPAIRAADVVHLHWINQGFLSLDGLHEVAALGKPVVWTLHDMWPFTGGCHYSRGCTHFRQRCGECPYLRRPAPGDLSHRIWEKKARLFPRDLYVVPCSEWLACLARESGLFRDHRVRAVPNPIDTQLFEPLSVSARTAWREEHGVAPGARVLLFAAMNVQETRKGFHHLVAALDRYKAQAGGPAVECVVLGKADPAALAALPYPVHALGLVRETERLVAAYAAADAFVIPSLEDNLPNTVMEALACGTPVLGFETGGIPEMIEHRENGYLAPAGSADALATGMSWLFAADPEPLRRAARAKAERAYSEKVVAQRYIDVYREALAGAK
jgi:glycosyltransferase involved in cell wall biosynthesis